MAAFAEAKTHKQRKEAVKGIGDKTMSTARSNYGMTVSDMEILVAMRFVAWYRHDTLERALRHMLSTEIIE